MRRVVKGVPYLEATFYKQVRQLSHGSNCLTAEATAKSASKAYNCLLRPAPFV
jgi:hypothetical protein